VSERSESNQLALVEYVATYFKEQIIANLAYTTQPAPALSIA